MGITKRDVSSLSKDGSAKLKGDVTLSEGTGVTLTQSGQDIEIAASSGSGDVVGPASSTDNAIARFDSTTGKLLQNTTTTLSDNGFLTFPSGGYLGGTSATDTLYLTAPGDGDYIILDASAGISMYTAQDITLTSDSDVIVEADALQADVINEHTTAAGVTIDGVLVKDGAIAKSVVGLGNVDNTSDATKNAAAVTLTNKTIDGDDNTITDLGTSSIKNDAITDAKLVYGKVRGRKGGSATNWTTPGTSDYDYSATNTFIQVGAATSNASAKVAVTFPVAFNQVPIVTGTVLSGATFATFHVESVTATTFEFDAFDAGGVRRALTCMWTAIGE